MSPVSPIKSIYIEDFQSHSKTNISLGGPGELTVIVGPTDSGKTAIVRGLRLLMYNVPQGTDYIRVGRQTATVAIELVDGTKVVRERSKSVNRYRIVKPGQSPQVFEGFGGSVPLEVQEATGVRVVTIGDSLELALNLSEQLDGPFLGKSVSGPAKAKILGALAGTEEVDEAQRQLGTDLYRASQDEKRFLSEIEVLDAKIREYDYLPALAERIAKLESLLQIVREAQDRLASLEAVSQKLACIQSQRTQALAVLAKWKNLKEAQFYVITVEGDAIRLNALVGHKVALSRITTDREAWTRLRNRWTNLSSAQTFVIEADSAQTRLRTLQSASETLVVTQAGKEKVAATLQRWANIDKAANTVTQISNCLARFQTLSDLRSRYNAIDAQARKVAQAYMNWAGLEAAQESLAKTVTLNARLEQLLAFNASLTRLRQSKVLAETEFEKHSKALADTRQQYIETLTALGKCPVCGSTINPSQIKEVA